VTVKAIATATAVLALIGAVLGLDARYWRVEAGEKAVAAASRAVDEKVGRLALSVEELRLKNEISTARLRLQYLASRAKPSPDEKEETEFVRAQILLQQKQLSDVQAAARK